ncbi:MAG: hypothetical protein DWQ44_10780 [Bacteroidetes bacterium]|nr:MAG: hypothetical protein DWQ33_08900 [Bacteroidota bacterium]REK05118.1 MAG: hypothetical protein DWQ39_07910 [Bacteroidota bacterium]REK32523.1 MAG: hypothetical protein DWQ44_10780 [Bacteroidota bacterium]REK49030.1 MAG: hypothetical protein DWQ48_09180 [Bacteroidota bacterium]
MRYLLVFICFFCSSFSNSEYRFIHSIPFTGVKSFTTDNLGLSYVVAGNQLLQFDSQGKPLAFFSESGLGELRSVDAGNPLKILLFYPDFARIIILNSKLSVQATVNLREAGIEQPVLACNSLNEGYWFYDRQDYQLKKMDLNLRISFRSQDLLSLTGKNLQPNFIIESGSYVYMNNPEEGIMMFDRFGNYYKTVPVTGLTDFQVRENEILFVRDNKFKSINIRSGLENVIQIPEHETLLQARIEQHQLYLLTSDSLKFYSF